MGFWAMREFEESTLGSSSQNLLELKGRLFKEKGWSRVFFTSSLLLPTGTLFLFKARDSTFPWNPSLHSQLDQKNLCL